MSRYAPVSIATILAGVFLFSLISGPGPLSAEEQAASSPAPGPIVGAAAMDPGAVGGAQQTGSLSSLDPALANGTPGEVLVIGRTPAPGKPGVAAISGLTAPGAIRELAGRSRIAVTRSESLARSRAARDLFPGGAWVISYDGDDDPRDVAARLRKDPAVAYAGPNHLLAITAAGPAVVDPLRDQQYGLDMVNAPLAWETSRGEGVLVAVIDTGVDVTHPDLAAQIHVNEAERDGVAGVDDDGNGYVDDIHGYDFTDAPDLPGVGDYLDPDPDPADEFGHGTQVAGVIAAVEGNGLGIAGVAPDAEILAVRAGFNTALPFLPALLQEDDAAKAILYAVDRGAMILNLSWGDLVEAPLIGEAVRYARSRGVLVVAGAGNDPGDRAFYPASYAGVVSVGAVDRNRARANFSTFGQDLDLLAPGVELWTTSPGGDYAERTGTSFSSPMAAGVAALVWSVHPDWTADQVAGQLRITASRGDAGWIRTGGWGILDAATAVAADDAPPVVQIEAVTGEPALLGKASPGDLGTRSSAAVPLLTIRGTVAATRLDRWTLSVMPESVAVRSGPADGDSEAVGERVLLANDRRQVVAESLAVFTPGPSDAGPWVARLRAWVAGRPVVEKRLRFAIPAPVLDFEDLAVELQVARDRGWDPIHRAGWDVVATWTSEIPYQGSVRLLPSAGSGAGGDTYFAEEVSAGLHHAVRLTAPLPVGDAVLEIAGRAPGAAIPQLLHTRPFTIGAVALDLDAMDVGDLPPGTPMRRSADWDGDGLAEVFLEAPPTSGNIYGNVQLYELGPPTLGFVPPTLLDSSDDFPRGIPVDIADADGDGLLELVVFRLDGWDIYEQDVSGEVPIRQIFHSGADSPVPVAFTETSTGTVLVAISGGGLTVYALDAGGNWGLASMASGSDTPLLHGGVLADFGWDGTVDAFFADAYGRLFRFTITGATVRYEGQHPLPAPVAGAMLAVPRQGGALELITTELDPLTPEVEGDLDRAAVRLRRWGWVENTLVQRTSLTFGGLTGAGGLRLQKWRGHALLSRGSMLDLVMLEGDGLQSGGGLPPSRHLSRVDGVAVTSAPVGFTDLLWRGNAISGEPGERVMIASRLESGGESWIAGAPPLRVVRALAVQDSLWIDLAWDAGGCPDPGVLTRYDPDGTVAPVPASEGRAATRVPLGGDEIVFHLERSPCVGRSLGVTPRAPQAPSPRWEGAETLVLEFEPPLLGLPRETHLRRGRDDRLVSAAVLDRSGRRLVIPVGETVPDSLVLVGAWDEFGLPPGGNERWTVAVSPRSDSAPAPVLTQVTYAGEGEPSLEVTVSGTGWAPSCNAPFRLDPLGWELTANPAPSLPGAAQQVYAIPLPEKLPPGNYTLVLRADCLAESERGPGQDRAFQVGIRIYPNPLAQGDQLTLENLEPGSRASLVDVSGRDVLSWQVEVSTERRALDGLAPGLYFVRVEDAQGRFLSHHKLLILR